MNCVDFLLFFNSGLDVVGCQMTAPDGAQLMFL